MKKPICRINPVITALDTPSGDEALSLVRLLRDDVWGFKVGPILFLSEGLPIIRRILALNTRIFLDLKFHDIPATVAGACRSAAKLGVSMFNIHASGGFEMMREAVRAVRESAPPKRRPILLGVTVLTSLDAKKLKEIGVKVKPQHQVVRLARLAKRAGLDGVVASPQEVSLIKKHCGKKFLVVAPGVRPAGASLDDQERVATPKSAVKNGADYLVIGRPITGAKSPKLALKAILQEIS